MKKTIISILVTLTLFSCKKGEDDPAISLRSRKERLAGEWSLASGKLTESYDDHANAIKFGRSFTFKSGRYEASQTIVNYTQFKGAFSLKLIIDKNGTFTSKEQFDSRELHAEGVWDFLQKSGDLKNKEEVNFIVGKLSKGSSYDYHVFNWGLTTMRYRIKELRNKTLVLTVQNDVVTNPAEFDLNYVGEFTFTQD
jgi:hypothetical protein